MDEGHLEDVIRTLAVSAGLGAVSAVVRLPTGRNNRGYRVELGAALLFAKVFFRDSPDERDRLGSELAFARFAWRCGVRTLAQPVAVDENHGVAVFRFVDGRRLQADEVDEARVAEALSFFEAVNAHRDAAADLPEAAEACFSLADHLSTAGARVERLAGIDRGLDVDGLAASFVGGELEPAWQRVQAGVRERARDAGIDFERPLDTAERCLSPSDFGFHNALLGADGRLVFHDFEYAGWDDPAKLVGDFFCQPELPAPRSCAHGFARAVAATLGLGDDHVARFEILAPIFRVKWCCIVLNEFLPAELRRRRFAAHDGSDEELDHELGVERRRAQLEKARRTLSELGG